MRVSNINLSNVTINNRNTSPQNCKKAQQAPAFKRANYKAAFAKCYNCLVNSPQSISNEQIYRELMAKARNASGATVAKLAETYFRPEDYEKVMSGFREEKPTYGRLNNSSCKKPLWLVCNGNTPVSYIVNFGPLGGLLHWIFGKCKEDTRICFQGVDEYKDYVICLGKDLSGKDTNGFTKEGFRTIYRYEVMKRW